MLFALIAVAIGIGLLAKSADQFVVGAVRLADSLHVSPVVIGAVVVGFGTSAPEIFVSGLAASQGEVDVGVGNIIGSNIANLTLVLGTAGVISVIGIHASVLRREAPLSTAAVVLFAVLVQGGLSRIEGVILLATLVGALALVLSASRDGDVAAGEVDELLDDTEPSLSIEGLRTFLGLVGTVGGAYLLVEGGTTIADELGLSGGFVGLTIVAVGTSLPELVTSGLAAHRGHADLIVGNLLGSNLFNSLAVGGITGVLADGPLQDGALAGVPIAVMVGVAVLAWVLMANGRRIVRSEGFALLAGYVATLPFMPR